MTDVLIELLDYDNDMRGEHSAAEMEQAIRRDGWDDFCFDLHAGSLETGYWRWIPKAPGSGASYDCYLSPAQPGRGAFLATVVTVAV